MKKFLSGLIIGFFLIANVTVFASSMSSVLISSSFSVHKNGTNQTGVVSGVNTKVTFGTEDWDTNSNFASDTFTPTIAGKYQLTATIFLNAANDQSHLQVMIYKNGVQHKTGEIWASGTAGLSGSSSCVVDANGTTDYFEVYIEHNNGVNKDIQGNNLYTFFQGYKIN